MTSKTQQLDRWIRTDFKQMNTVLEELYFNSEDRLSTATVGSEIKQQLMTEGQQRICALLEEGNTDQGPDRGSTLLGDVGFYMAALHRHEIQSSDAWKNASALAMQLGASLGVAPRYASCHLETHNRAENGVFKSFTSLDDERLFIEYNTRGVFAFIRASEALRHIIPLGVSHPLTYDLLLAAKQALDDVYDSNQFLFENLDIERFFFCVRPYYRPHKVGLRECRGANAGDFAGINVIDLLLGLCNGNDPYYSQLLVDKFLFMRPEDQLVLRDCMKHESLLDSFLVCSAAHSKDPGLQKNLALFLQVCDLHGRVALQHHEQLVNKYVVKPAEDGGYTDKKNLTASGPPLSVLVKSLQRLCDLRCAANIDDSLGYQTRYADMSRLKDQLL